MSSEHTEKGSLVSHAVVHRFDLSMENLVTNMVSYVQRYA